MLDLLRVHGDCGGALRGVATVHGSLDEYQVQPPETTTAAAAARRYPPVLVLHGGADPVVPEHKARAFLGEMALRQVAVDLVDFQGARHGFSRPDKVPGDQTAAFDPAAAAETWRRLTEFVQAHTGVPH